MTTPLIWVLADDRAGNVAQCMGVAEALGLPFEVKNIQYNGLGRLPNFLLGPSLAALSEPGSSPIAPPWPDLVIAAGRRTAPIALYIKSKNPRCLLAQIMLPGFKGEFFDLIAVPDHDRVPDAPNLLRTIGSPHRITAEKLAEAQKQWEPVFSTLPHPRIAMLVGGKSKHGEFSFEDLRELGAMAADLARRRGGSLMVTTSRRSGPGVDNILKNAIGDLPVHFHGWGAKGDNPYLGYLATADIIIATGDSISMCSEACTSGKPVYIFDRPSNSAPKHSHFHKTLYELGLARPLDDAAEGEQWFTRYPLHAAQDVANAIKGKVIRIESRESSEDKENHSTLDSRL